MTTLLVSPAELAGAEVVVREAEFRHLFRAQRLRAGEEIRVSDGRGGARVARVQAVTKREARLVLGRKVESEDPALELVICSALPRSERARWLVEKGAELGAREILFYSSTRAPRALTGAAQERLVRVAAAAFTQSDGSRLTAIRGLVAWPDLVAECGEDRTLLLEPGERGRVLEEIPTGGKVRLIVGPEGGLTAEEVDQLLAVGAFPWRLGPRRLRVETAAIAAASRLLAR